MADVIRLTAAEVRTLADKFGQAGNDTQEMLNRLGTEVSNAASGWEGDAYNSFVDKFGEIRTQMNSVVEMYQGIEEMLDKIVDSIVEADVNLANAVTGSGN